MDNDEQKSNLWKTYGILMGIMLGGSALMLGGQSVWNNIQAERFRQAAAEEQAYSKYTQSLQKISDQYDLSMPSSNRSSDISKAQQYCSDFSAGKTNLQQDWAGISKISSKQAILLAQVQSYCPENLVKLPKEVQTQLATLDNITQKQAAAFIKRWLEAKKSLFSSPFDRRLATEILTGKALEERISSMDWLIKYGSWYSYGNQRIDSVDAFVSSQDTATITLTITETRTLHQPAGDKQSGETSQSIFDLTQKDGSLKILDVHNK